MKNTLFVLLSFLLLNSTYSQTYQWASSSQSQESYYTTTDASGNIYEIGKWAGSATFPNNLSLTQNGSFYNNWFLAKYNNNGQIQWVKEAFSQKGDREVLALKTDQYDNIYYAGYFDDTLRVSSSSVISRGNRDAFLVKLNNSGNLSWIRTGGGTFDDSFTDIVCHNNNISVTGFYVPNAIFGTDTLKGTTTNLSSNAMVVSYDNSGNINFAKYFGGISNESAEAITYYNNKLYFTGFFRSQDAYFQNTTLHWSGTSGQYDVFVASIDLSGNIEWAKGFNNKNTSNFFRSTNSIFANSSGIYLSGHYAISASPNSTIITTDPNASQNAYLTKYSFDGNNIWAKSFKGPKYVNIKNICGTNDKIFVAGNFTDTLKIDNQNYIGKFNSFTVYNNAFISSYNNDGTLSWLKTILPYSNPSYPSVIGTMYINNIANSNNDIYLTGGFSQKINFNNLIVSTIDTTVLSDIDAYITKMAAQTNNIQAFADNNIFVQYNINDKLLNISNISERTNFYIYNIVGQPIYFDQIVNKKQIDLSFLSAGIYIVKFDNGYYFKFLKN